MKRPFLKLAIIALSIAPAWAAEDFKLPIDLGKLAERATESVDVTLDQSTLQLASGFLSKDDPDEAQVKKVIGKLKGIYVRSFTFDKEGQYSMSDVQAMRAQLKGPNWSRIVGVRSIKGENTEVYLLKNGDQIAGIVVLDAEPKELTIVHVDGSISPEELSRLGGHMGIPEMERRKKKTRSDSAPEPKDDEREDDRTER
jgi:Domain of unknown function (DUF4252)